MVFVGITSQIYKNYKEKKVGINVILIVLSFGAYTARFGYAICIESFYILIPDFFGMIFCAVMFVQYRIYNK